MASSHEIKCTNKSNRATLYERILNIGGLTTDGIRWKVSETEAIFGIESNQWRFFINKAGYKVNVVVAQSSTGNKYLATEEDTSEINNLLYLPESF